MHGPVPALPPRLAFCAFTRRLGVHRGVSFVQEIRQRGEWVALRRGRRLQQLQRRHGSAHGHGVKQQRGWVRLDSFRRIGIKRCSCNSREEGYPVVAGRLWGLRLRARSTCTARAVLLSMRRRTLDGDVAVLLVAIPLVNARANTRSAVAAHHLSGAMRVAGLRHGQHLLQHVLPVRCGQHNGTRARQVLLYVVQHFQVLFRGLIRCRIKADANVWAATVVVRRLINVGAASNPVALQQAHIVVEDRELLRLTSVRHAALRSRPAAV
jgi:hypothetical protein